MQVLTINQYMTRSRNMWILECRNAAAGTATAARIGRPIAFNSFLPSLSKHKIRNKKKIRQTHPKRIQSYFYVQAENVIPIVNTKRERERGTIKRLRTKQANRIRRRKNGIDNKKIDALTQLLCYVRAELSQLRFNHSLLTQKTTKQNKKHSNVQHVKLRFFIACVLFSKKEEKKKKYFVRHQTTCGTKISVSVACSE